MYLKLQNTFLQKIQVILLAAFLFGIFAFTGCAQEKSKKSENTFEKNGFNLELDSLIKSVVAEYDIPGMSVTVVKGNEKLIGCYGKLDEDLSKPVNPNTLFSVQSVSKTFTAIAVLKATEHGLAHLDSPITKYLSNFQINSVHQTDAQHSITLRHLLSHTSGLPSDAPSGNTFSKSPNGISYVTLEERIASLKDVWLRDSVGRRYYYSNVGFDLAAYIVERQSGKPFSRYVKENVLNTMHMKSSTFKLDSMSSLSNRAVGHIYQADEEIPVAFSALGAGGLYSSAEDMEHFLAVATRLFSDVLNENNLHQLVTVPSGTNNGYALGVVTNRIQYCTPFFSHTGNGYGFTSSVGWIPEYSMGFAILCNRESTYNVLEQIQQAIMDHFLLNAKKRAFCQDINTLPSVISQENGDYYKSVSGEYSNGTIGLQFEFHDSVFGILAPDDGSFHQIHFQSRNCWLFEDNGITYQFLLRDDILTNQNNGLTFTKVSNQTPKPNQVDPKWRSKSGRYRSYAYGVLPSFESIEWNDGNLYLNGNVLQEHLPGLFFDSFGQIVDFRENRVRIEYANYIKLD